MLIEEQFVGFYTKLQLSNLMRFWGAREGPPDPGPIVTSIPVGGRFRKAIISKHDRVDEYGRETFKVVETD